MGPVAFLAAALALSLVMATAWLWQRRTGNAGWADAFWSFGTGLVGSAAALLPVTALGPSLRQGLVAAAAAAWGIRLGSHIAARTQGGSEDPRYAKLRSDWGPGFQYRLFLFLQLQALAALPLVLAIAVAAHQPAPGLRPADLIGFAIMLAAILGEATADRELRRFKAAPHGQGAICDRGLWAWSRHPNYFFEWLGWVGYCAIALPLPDLRYTPGWLSLVAPLVMYWLLVRVSGIPPLEAHLLASRGAAFRAYQQRTSPFFPLPPRRPALEAEP